MKLVPHLCTLFLCAYIANSQDLVRTEEFNPDSHSEYIPLKFDLGIPPGTKISTVEGNTTALVNSILTIEGTPEVGVSGLNSGFVKAQGTQFVVDGKPFYCGGTLPCGTLGPELYHIHAKLFKER